MNKQESAISSTKTSMKSQKGRIKPVKTNQEWISEVEKLYKRVSYMTQENYDQATSVDDEAEEQREELYHSPRFKSIVNEAMASQTLGSFLRIGADQDEKEKLAILSASFFADSEIFREALIHRQLLVFNLPPELHD